MKFTSSQKTKIFDDNNTLYELDNFEYLLDKEFLKGNNIYVMENYNLPDREKNRYYFANGFFDFKNKQFITGDTKIILKSNTFDRIDNDPRLYGISSSQKNNITKVNKAVFTSCKKNDNCPPWRLESSEIKHDKNKKQILYKDTVLKVYDLPIFYFPKFFHPDPTVKRQSGFLTPRLNNSNVLGSSLKIPYFQVISENKDFTFTPSVFSKNIIMIQNEFRQANKNSNFIADFGITNGYKSSIANKKKNINHIFLEYKKNLDFQNFLKSDLDLFIEKTNKDTYLKIFSDNLQESKIKPNSFDVLQSGFNVVLEHEKYSLSSGADIYEDLKKPLSDRYQYVLPYYKFSSSPILTKYGSYDFKSSGNNILDNTNNLKTRVINDIGFSVNDNIFENLGIKNNINFYFKNLNSVGKNVSNYKSSPQIEFQSLTEFKSELPLIRKNKNIDETLIPRLSLRVNPSDMKDYSSSERRINTDNIFNVNRLGIDDSFESGNSITVGVDYLKKDNKKNDDKSLEIKLASVFRDDKENNIPELSSINNKSSNIFGSLEYKYSKNIILDYEFAMDNKVEEFKYNSIGLDLSLNNFITEFNFIEENSIIGDTNIIENKTSYNFNKENSLFFKTRRNREINLTEYYNLVYEYKNDCLTAGIKFNKTYYNDRDLKPSENLMFTISFYPITTFEQSLD